MIAFALKWAVLALWTAAMATLIALYARDAFSLEKLIQPTCIDRAFSFGDRGRVAPATRRIAECRRRQVPPNHAISGQAWSCNGRARNCGNSSSPPTLFLTGSSNG